MFIQGSQRLVEKSSFTMSTTRNGLGDGPNTRMTALCLKYLFLVESFWGFLPPPKKKNTLQTCTSHLTRSLVF